METTGLPAATASISTPEVTWSRESYGSSTTSACRTTWCSSAVVEVARRRTRPGQPTPRSATRCSSCAGTASPSARDLRVGLAERPGSAAAGAGRAGRAMASIAHSMPLPGPSSPQVSTVGRASARRRDSSSRAWTAVGRESGPREGRRGHPSGRRRTGRGAVPRGLRSSSPTASARGDHRRASARWCGVGVVRTVCRTDDDRDVSTRTTVEDVLAVGAAEDAVLVLDDRDVEVVEGGRGGRRRLGVRSGPTRGPAENRPVLGSSWASATATISTTSRRAAQGRASTRR